MFEALGLFLFFYGFAILGSILKAGEQFFLVVICSILLVIVFQLCDIRHKISRK